MVVEEIELNNVTTVSQLYMGGKLWCIATAGLAEGSDFYSADDWDLQIKLKRKPKPFKVGDRVHTTYSPSVMVIDAISEAFGQGDETECWLRLTDGSHSTFEAGYLRHAAPEVTNGIQTKQNA